MDGKRLQDLLEEESKGKWKNIAKLCFSQAWNVIIVTQVYITCLVCLYRLGFDRDVFFMIAFLYVADAFYFLDVLCAMVYYNAKTVQKIVHVRPRLWSHFCVDVISLVPLELSYGIYYFSEGKDRLVNHVLLQNRCLRIYRLRRIFQDYDTRIRHPYEYFITCLIRFVAVLILIVHGYTCIWYNVSSTMPCTRSRVYCWLWHETNMLFIALQNWTGPPKLVTTLPERLVVCMVIIFGFFFIYGYCYPMVMHIFSKIYRPYGEYLHKYLRLECFLNNQISGPVLKEKTRRYYDHIWNSGNNYRNDNVIKSLPLALRKDVFTDIYWEAFRHSELFRAVSRSCKRSLSLVMRTSCHQEGDIVWEKGERKQAMVYLVQGILQLMAEENDESPVVSFSSGTVLGEISLFLQTDSNGTIKCGTACELQVLRLTDACEVLKDYPKDHKEIIRRLRRRVLLSESTQWRKEKLCVLKSNGNEEIGTFTRDSEDCVKWMKEQWRAVWEAHKRHLLVTTHQRDGLHVPSWRKNHQISQRIEHMSNYLDCLVVSDNVEVKKDVVCLKTSFPWSIDSNAIFLRHWTAFVAVASLIPGILYPFCTAWLETFPKSVYEISMILTLIFQVDVLLKLLTAVKTSDGIITKFTQVALHRLKSPFFYCDLVAAFPSQLYIEFYEDKSQMRSYEIGFYLHVALFKVHMFFRLYGSSVKRKTFVILLKNTFICLLFIYWFAEYLQLTGVRCVAPCVARDWSERGSDDGFTTYSNAFTMAFVAALSVSSDAHFPSEIKSMVIVLVLRIFFFFFFCLFLGDLYASYTIKIANEIKFQTVLDRLKDLMRMIRIPKHVERQMLQIIEFQWQYDRGDYIMSKTQIIDEATPCLRREIFTEKAYNIFRKSKMFENEPMEFIIDVMEKASLVAVPADTVLMSQGTQCFVVNVVVKGFCQVNSFFPKDARKSIAHPFLIGEGVMFPAVTGFCNVPAPISVTTLTDCEIVMINLEDLLQIMIKHGLFKDVAEVIKNGNYQQKLGSVPALTKKNVRFNQPVDEKSMYKKPFRRLGVFGMCIQFLLFRRTFSYGSSFVIFWDAFYQAYRYVLCFLWPMCFGALIYHSHIIVPCLFASKILIVLNVYIHFHIPYFNERGILVTHPLYTAAHCLKTSFPMEVLSSVPFYLAYRYSYKNPDEPDNAYIVCAHIAQRLLVLFPIMDYLSYWGSLSRHKTTYRIVKLIATIIVLLNFYVCMKMYIGANWTHVDGRYVGFELHPEHWKINIRVVEKDSISDYFILASYWIIIHMTTNVHYNYGVAVSELILTSINSVVGTVIIFVVYASASSSSFVSNLHVTIYQDRMKSFIEFLKSANCDGRIIESAVSHFEHHWSRSQGENLGEILDRLPRLLYEDLMLPFYKPTLSKIGVFARANEGFYRALSTQVVHEYFSRGSVIISEDEVQSDIYFVHKGKCFVLDWFLTLDVGSMIGDIKRTGVMANKIYALTHVELLKISSDYFYVILNDFYETEREFLEELDGIEDYIKSDYQRRKNEVRTVDSRDALHAFGLGTKEISFENQSYFNDPTNTLLREEYSFKMMKKERKFTLVIYPDSPGMRVYQAVSLTVAFLTLFLVPVFFLMGPFSNLAFVVVAFLDACWLIKILTTFRVGVTDKVKGALMTDWKSIAARYCFKSDGFFADLLATVPFEWILIYLEDSYDEVNPTFFLLLRALRLIRGLYLITYLKSETRKLKVSYFARWTKLLVVQSLYLNTMALVNVAVSQNEVFDQAKDLYDFGWIQMEALVLSYLSVLNVFTSTNIFVMKLNHIAELSFHNVLALTSVLIKAYLVSSVLSVMYVSQLTRAEYKHQVNYVETYLKANQTSPAALKQVLDYKHKLLLCCRSESMPVFLLTAPPNLKTAIMENLYVQRLKSCPLFENINENFLQQLSRRLLRQIFFTDQKIVEKGDVDNNLYFVHKGEVNAIEQTSVAAYVEYVVDVLVAGDHFGEAQGLWVARPHRYTYRARTFVEILLLNSRAWSDLRRGFPEISDLIRSRGRKLDESFFLG